ASFGLSSTSVPLRSRLSATTEHPGSRTGGRANGRMRLAGARAGRRDLLPAPSFSDGFPARRERRWRKHTFEEASSLVCREQVIKPLRGIFLASQLRYFSNGNQSAVSSFGQGLFNNVS